MAPKLTIYLALTAVALTLTGVGANAQNQQNQKRAVPAAPHVAAPAPRISAPAAPRINAAPRISAAPHFNAPRIAAPQAPHMSPGVRAFHAPPQRGANVSQQIRVNRSFSNRQTGRGQITRSQNGRRAAQTAARGRAPSNRIAKQTFSRQGRVGNAHNRGLASRNTQNPSATLSNRAGRVGGVGAQQALRGGYINDRQLSERRFEERREARRRVRGGFVGWFGPVYWPYVYDDIFDYAFWPGDFEGDYWGYAYGDVFASTLFPYVSGSLYASSDIAGLEGSDNGNITPRQRNRAGVRGLEGQSRQFAELCGDRTPGLTDWPFVRIEDIVKPNEEQQAALDEMKSAAAQAVQELKNSCPTEVPITPLGRLDSMAQRLEATVRTVDIVRPALGKFYDTLSDEQKARFNAIGTQEPAAANSRGASAQQPRQQVNQGSPVQLCNHESAAGFTDQSLNRIEQRVRPNQDQRAAFDDLKGAIGKASDVLQAACPAETPLTPLSRLDAIEKRIEAMLQAIKIERPALASFYSLLSNEQKARFNTLVSQL